MKKEVIKEIRVLEDGKLLLELESGGDNSYQYIYREAAGIYWEPTLKGFISTEPKEWTYSTCFFHMVEIIRQVGIEVQLADQTSWSGLDKSEQQHILNAIAT
ncbi:MAG: hypothetical protein Q3M24_07250 [Candidatus Electrothrix aestuarii]|uniref:Integron Cassette Protein Hfx-Cass5 domain-containing protein n=1 Tax=Candidatus Electrothrix aestuarii TaxID=3062594 RepID=A0AAU8LZX2_9BACT|nr:hypothetical protein [Candidatus Electrothrix aestuarii]